MFDIAARDRLPPEDVSAPHGVVRRILQSSARSVGFIALGGVTDSLDLVEWLAQSFVKMGSSAVVIETSGLRTADAPSPSVMGASLADLRKEPGLWIVGPATVPRNGSYARTLRSTLVSARPHADCVLVDLSGVPALGEKLAAARLLDTVCLFGAPGLTREAEAVRFANELGPERLLGVVMVER